MLCEPEEVGLSHQRLEVLKTAISSYLSEDKFSGMTTLIYKNGKIPHFHCYGYQDRESQTAITTDTLFRIYSMTKPVTAVALMMLFEEGKFILDDPLSDYIPAFSNLKVYAGLAAGKPRLAGLERPVTIRDLFQHTAGFGYGLFEDSPVEALYRDQNLFSPSLTLAAPLETLVEKVAELPLVHQPGSQWRYSIATDIMGHLVAVLADQPFDEFLKQRLFQPLAMDDTSFAVPREKSHRLATLYGLGPAGSSIAIDDAQSSAFLQENHLPGKWGPSGGGGLVSSSLDYLRFARMLLNKGTLDGVRILSKASCELMTQNHLSQRHLPYSVGPIVQAGSGWGLGISVMQDSAQAGLLGPNGTYGWGGAAGTFFWVDPINDLIAIIMPQYLFFQEPHRLKFRNLVYQSLID